MVVATRMGTSPIQSPAKLGSVSGRISRCSFHFAAGNSLKCGVLGGHNHFVTCLSSKQYQQLLHKRDLMVSCLPKKAGLGLTTCASKKRKLSQTEYSCAPLASFFPLASAISLQGQDQWAMDWCCLNRTSFPYCTRRDVRIFKSCGRRNFGHALLEGSGHIDGTNLLAQDGLRPSPESETSSMSISEHDTTDGLDAKVKSDDSSGNAGRSGIVSFYRVQLADGAEVDHEKQADKKGWISSLWLLGPTALVSSVVLPPFCLRKLFEVILEDSLVKDFLILFFTEALFYIGVAIFLFIAHRVQKSGGVITWKSASYVSLAYKVSSIITTALGVLLPVVAFAIVWPWTGPAAAAALFPYIAGLAVQYGFEQFIREKKSFIWPLVPIVFQVYRLHQLNRATQLIAGLLYSLRGAEATAETLAINGSLQTLVSMLQVLGMLCLWSLSAFLTYVFCSESQSWQSRVLASEQT